MAPDHTFPLTGSAPSVHSFSDYTVAVTKAWKLLKRPRPHSQDASQCLYSWKNRLTTYPPSLRPVIGGVAHKRKRVENLKQALGEQANKFNHLLFPPPLSEIQYLYFSASRIAEQDLSQENYRPAYYKTDVLQWQSAFSLTSHSLSLQLASAFAIINVCVIPTVSEAIAGTLHLKT